MKKIVCSFYALHHDKIKDDVWRQGWLFKRRGNETGQKKRNKKGNAEQHRSTTQNCLQLQYRTIPIHIFARISPWKLLTLSWALGELCWIHFHPRTNPNSTFGPNTRPVSKTTQIIQIVQHDECISGANISDLLLYRFTFKYDPAEQTQTSATYIEEFFTSIFTYSI